MTIQKEIINWLLLSGVEDTIGTVPINRLTAKQERVLLTTPISSVIQSKPSALQTTLPDNLLQNAVQSARQAQTLEELKKALSSFEGCALKKTAKNLVFGQGVPHADVMFIGEAPGAEEDKLALPFVGECGKLLDKMLVAIGLSRQTNAYISNIVPWRPPGNRTPSELERSLCLPFIQRHIELVCPKIIVALGSVALSALIKNATTISKSRGLWYSYQSEGLVAPIPVLPMFHPSFLLRTPTQKKYAWHDFLLLQDKLLQLPK